MDPSQMAETPPSGRHAADAPLAAGQLHRLQQGDRTTFQTLVRPLLGALLGLARRLTGDPHWAEDLVQETLIHGYRGIGAFRGDSSLRTWLLRIQVRLARRPERWQRGRRTEALDAPIPDVLAPLPETETEARELAARLDEAMERLTARQRAALHLRAVEGLDYETIAAVLGGGAANARTLVLNARRHVMRRLGRHLEP